MHTPPIDGFYRYGVLVASYVGQCTCTSILLSSSSFYGPKLQGCLGTPWSAVVSPLPSLPNLYDLELEAFLELGSNTGPYTGELELRIFWRIFNLKGRISGISMYLSPSRSLTIYPSLFPASNMDPYTGEIELRIYLRVQKHFFLSYSFLSLSILIYLSSKLYH